MVKMAYSLYKLFYKEFPAEGYDPKSKTILVDMPEVRRKRFPREWKRNGNHYTTPGGCEVIFWNTGYAENFMVRRWISAENIKERTIHPGIHAREQVLECVAEFEAIER